MEVFFYERFICVLAQSLGVDVLRVFLVVDFGFDIVLFCL